MCRLADMRGPTECRYSQLLGARTCLNACVVCREQAAMAKSIYKLLDQKFNLLLPENVPAAGAASSGARDAGLRSIDELKKVINSHLRVRESGRWCECVGWQSWVGGLVKRAPSLEHAG